ncbi:hypothetical protein V6N13_028006 [Hibiscus sabdariffa]|uniref:Uncharacterized protein n=1 Tax=Hibiscus sabdariffa TaxID=183260 RepID=A0ABR2CG92_9ROSI
MQIGPVHKAVAGKGHAELKRILASLRRLWNPADIRKEANSLAEKADAISAVIDRRDVPNRDTPLHLAVKLGDKTAAEMLMVAVADWWLQNKQGWNALHEVICNREEVIAMIIIRHDPPSAWAKPRNVLGGYPVYKAEAIRRLKDLLSAHYKASTWYLPCQAEAKKKKGNSSSR